MKKLVAFLLVVIMCLALFACGNGKKAFVGVWVSDDDTQLVVLEDGTCFIDDTLYKWSYDKDLDMYTIFSEIPVNITLEEEDGVRFFDIWGMVKYYHADDYHKVADANK